jgi:hypothetical protein
METKGEEEGKVRIIAWGRIEHDQVNCILGLRLTTSFQTLCAFPKTPMLLNIFANRRQWKHLYYVHRRLLFGDAPWCWSKLKLLEVVFSFAMIEFEFWAMLHSFSCLDQGNVVFQSTKTSWQFSWTSLNNSFVQNIKSLGVECAIITKLELEIQMAPNHLWKTILHVSYSIAPYGDYMEMTQILETSSPTSKIKIVLCLTSLKSHCSLKKYPLEHQITSSWWEFSKAMSSFFGGYHLLKWA